eukprot:scaffold1301_cov128-Cylindrotheca_fusiformis.AAC.11
MLFLVFLTIFFPVTFGFGSSKPSIFLRVVSLILGTFATALRMRVIFNICHGNEASAIFPFTSLRNETFSKQACAFKVANIQKNAIEVHHQRRDRKQSTFETSFGRALANFSRMDMQYVQRCSFKDFYSKSARIFTEDGLFYSGRHIAGNVAQWILCIFIVGNGVAWTLHISEAWMPEEQRADQVASSLDFVITLAANELLLQQAVESILQRVVLFVLRVLYFLDNAGVLRLDCILLGEFLESFCQRTAFDDEDDGEFACSLFAGEPKNLCRIMDPFFRPSSPIGKPVSVDEMVSTINVTELVAPLRTVVSKTVSDTISDKMNQLYPEYRYMVVAPVAFGTLCAFICSTTIALALLPSITATTLQLRSGLVKSVSDPEKRPAYLSFVNKGTYLFGSMFWGIIAASLLIGGIAGALLFFSMWQVTAFMAAQALALGIGIGVCLTLKWVVTRTCRVKIYQGLYRRNPLSANIVELLNESFNFATSMAIAVVRMIKLLFLSAYYVGRIDKSFLAPNVGQYLDGRLVIDYLPDFFIADILSTEAHRHPYIESLGVTYLYKLKYGEGFISRAGSAWRVLFVTALMPWLQKYRFEAKGKGFNPVIEDA